MLEVPLADSERTHPQAKVRDQQLQESVFLARDAIVREKKKRAEFVSCRLLVLSLSWTQLSGLQYGIATTADHGRRVRLQYGVYIL